MPYDDDPTTSYQPGGDSNSHSSGYEEDDPTTSYSPGDYSSSTSKDYGSNYNSGYRTSKEYNYRDYDRYDDNNDNILGEFIFSFLVILIAFIVPYLFYFLKKGLAKLKWLSPRILVMLDKLEPVFTKLATKVGNKAVAKGTGKRVSSRPNETTEIVKDTVASSLKEKLVVDPNLPDAPNLDDLTNEHATYVANEDEEIVLPNKIGDQEVPYVDPMDPHSIIKRNLKG